MWPMYFRCLRFGKSNWIVRLGKSRQGKNVNTNLDWPPHWSGYTTTFNLNMVTLFTAKHPLAFSSGFCPKDKLQDPQILHKTRLLKFTVEAPSKLENGTQRPGIPPASVMML